MKLLRLLFWHRKPKDTLAANVTVHGLIDLRLGSFWIQEPPQCQLFMLSALCAAMYGIYVLLRVLGSGIEGKGEILLCAGDGSLSCSHPCLGPHGSRGDTLVDLLTRLQVFPHFPLAPGEGKLITARCGDNRHSEDSCIQSCESISTREGIAVRLCRKSAPHTEGQHSARASASLYPSQSPPSGGDLILTLQMRNLMRSGFVTLPRARRRSRGVI